MNVSNSFKNESCFQGWIEYCDESSRRYRAERKDHGVWLVFSQVKSGDFSILGGVQVFDDAADLREFHKQVEALEAIDSDDF